MEVKCPLPPLNEHPADGGQQATRGLVQGSTFRHILLTANVLVDATVSTVPYSTTVTE